MPNSHLFDLPNELLLFIFEYLTSLDLFMAFFDLKSCRIQTLLKDFLETVDITKRDNPWIHAHLSKIFPQAKIPILRLQDNQVASVSKYLPLGDIQAIEVISSGLDNQISEGDLIEFRRYLKNLTIIVRCSIGKEKFIPQLFPRALYSTHSYSTCRFYYPNNDDIYICPQLTYLTIDVTNIDEVFMFIKRLPNLQELKVNLRCPFAKYVPVVNVERMTPCQTLRHVTLTGYSRYFYELNRFFAIFGSTIESLILHMRIACDQLDGRDLERDILKGMPLLSSLEFFIETKPDVRTDCLHASIDIRTFQTTEWKYVKPVVCWNGFQSDSRKIFSLPYKLNDFTIESNQSIASYVTNRRVKLRFEHVRCLSMSSISPWWTRQTFEFIKKAFPNIRILRMICVWGNNEYQKHKAFPDMRYPELFNDDFSSYHNVQLPSITRLCLQIESFLYHIETFRYLFHLLPNLTCIETNQTDFPSRYLFKSDEHENSFIMDRLASIKIKPLKSLLDRNIADANLRKEYET